MDLRTFRKDLLRSLKSHQTRRSLPSLPSLPHLRHEGRLGGGGLETTLFGAEIKETTGAEEEKSDQGESEASERRGKR